eukprot:3745032-Rhodomonas_salina.1
MCITAIARPPAGVCSPNVASCSVVQYEITFCHDSCSPAHPHPALDHGPAETDSSALYTHDLQSVHACGMLHVPPTWAAPQTDAPARCDSAGGSETDDPEQCERAGRHTWTILPAAGASSTARPATCSSHTTCNTESPSTHPTSTSSSVSSPSGTVSSRQSQKSVASLVLVFGFTTSASAAGNCGWSMQPVPYLRCAGWTVTASEYFKQCASESGSGSGWKSASCTGPGTDTHEKERQSGPVELILHHTQESMSAVQTSAAAQLQHMLERADGRPGCSKRSNSH